MSALIPTQPSRQRRMPGQGEPSRRRRRHARADSMSSSTRFGYASVPTRHSITERSTTTSGAPTRAARHAVSAAAAANVPAVYSWIRAPTWTGRLVRDAVARHPRAVGLDDEPARRRSDVGAGLAVVGDAHEREARVARRAARRARTRSPRAHRRRGSRRSRRRRPRRRAASARRRGSRDRRPRSASRRSGTGTARRRGRDPAAASTRPDATCGADRRRAARPCRRRRRARRGASSRTAPRSRRRARGRGARPTPPPPQRTPPITARRVLSSTRTANIARATVERPRSDEIEDLGPAAVARRRHDVIGELPRARSQPSARHHRDRRAVEQLACRSCRHRSRARGMGRGHGARSTISTPTHLESPSGVTVNEWPPN